MAAPHPQIPASFKDRLCLAFRVFPQYVVSAVAALAFRVEAVPFIALRSQEAIGFGIDATADRGGTVLGAIVVLAGWIGIVHPGRVQRWVAIWSGGQFAGGRTWFDGHLGGTRLTVRWAEGHFGVAGSVALPNPLTYGLIIPCVRANAIVRSWLRSLKTPGRCIRRLDDVSVVVCDADALGYGIITNLTLEEICAVDAAQVSLSDFCSGAEGGAPVGYKCDDK